MSIEMWKDVFSSFKRKNKWKRNDVTPREKDLQMAILKAAKWGK